MQYISQRQINQTKKNMHLYFTLFSLCKNENYFKDYLFSNEKHKSLAWRYWKSLKLHNKMLNITKKMKCGILTRMHTPKITQSLQTQPDVKFETVFTFPYIKYLALFNRLKAYHIVGSSIAIPSSGLLEWFNLFPHQTFLTATYIGVTAAGLLSLASLPFKNVIGFLYISEDNKQIKISSVNFWGKRIDRVLPVDDWIPLLDMAPKKSDLLYLTPHLADNTKYKWFVKFGHVLNQKKIGEVLE